MGFVVPLALFLCIAGVIIFANWNRAQERKATLEVVERLLEKGQPAPPDLIASLGYRPMRQSLRDLRLGLVMLAMAAGFLIMAWCQWRFSRAEVPYVNGSMVGAAAFPGLIGLVLVGFWLFGRNNPGEGQDF
jgi:hypothetical protein